MKAVYLEWLDSIAIFGWQDETAHKEVMKPIKSIGWIVKEDKNSITISTSLGHKDYHSPLTIPKVAVVKREDSIIPL